MTEEQNSENLRGLTASLVSSYVANNQLPAEQLPMLIASVYGTLKGLGVAKSEPTPEPLLKPAVPVKKSLFPDHIICLEDGKSFKTMRRHLMSDHDMTPEQYRAKWSLPDDYPMVAPDYAERRSSLAKQSGLGRKPVILAEESKPKARRRKQA